MPAKMLTRLAGASLWIGSLLAVPPAAAELRIVLGVATASGFDEVQDLHEDNLEAQGFVTDSVSGLPAGVFISGYYEFDNGLGVGAGIGPAMLILGDTDYADFPLSVDVRYSLTIAGVPFVPYLRAGVMKHLVSGEFVEGDTSGAVIGIGAEWRREGGVDFGFELASSDSEVEIENLSRGGTETFKPFDTRFSVFLAF